MMRFAERPPIIWCCVAQIIISIRSKDNHRPVAVEALRRAKFKFPGRQKILQSNKWGFTKYAREVSVPPSHGRGWVMMLDAQAR